MNRSTQHSFFVAVVLFVVAVGCRKAYPEGIPEPDPLVAAAATPYNFEGLPFFSPPMDIPLDNPMTIEGVDLGRHLFWEKTLSLDNTISCGSCHVPEKGFSDPNQFSVGVGGAIGSRQSMPIVNIGWANDFFWDGRAHTLEEQILDPVPNPVEMHLEWQEAVERLSENPLYVEKFQNAFGTSEITKELTTKAIAQFLRTMVSFNSKYDRDRLGIEYLNDAEIRGFELFTQEGGFGTGGQGGADCFHCHNPGGGMFTDFLPHNNGLDSIFSDLGYGGVNGDPLDYGKFKTPTLRNVEFTAPYMHDGRFQTLEEVIDHYDSGGHDSPTIDPFMKFAEGGLQLDEQKKADLLAFLKALSDEEFISNPAFSNPFE